ncbi:MAG: hypothetical protein ACKOGA_05130, partial [Planctomycetaceae bacterium]
MTAPVWVLQTPAAAGIVTLAQRACKPPPRPAPNSRQGAPTPAFLRRLLPKPHPSTVCATPAPSPLPPAPCGHPGFTQPP